MQDLRRQPEIHKGQMHMSQNKNYPLHPEQTHAAPPYAQLPLEEYERIMKENARMKETLKRHGITLLEEKWNAEDAREKSRTTKVIRLYRSQT